MDPIELFEYKGAFYHVPRDVHEVREKYIERAEYVIILVAEKKIKYEDAIMKSRIWSNMRHLGCDYDNNGVGAAGSTLD